MAKGKEQKGDHLKNGPLTRMNFLYQASLLMSKLPSHSKLSCYYGKLMKEISMKMMEKIHPDIKRTMCSSCNSSLICTNNQINVKVKSQSKKKNKLYKKNLETKKSKRMAFKNKNCDATSSSNYTKSRIKRRNEKPNKVLYYCYTCGFSKGFLQQPNYKIWIHKIHDC